ncbi:MAG: ABC transporter ATP-binding protein [Gemmatimonadetes bacterium]|nr:ABC transporter ATP-binding protein [Gemmatimonadota bacterium]
MLRDIGNKLKLYGVVESLHNNAWQIAVFVVLSVVSVVLNIAKPIVFSRIIDTGLIEQDWDNVLYYCIAFSVIAVLISVNSLGYGMITSLVSNRFVATIKKSLINRIYLLDYHFFNKTSGGDILTRLKSDTDNIRNFFMAVLNNSLVSFLGFLSAMIYIGVVEWKMLIPGFAVVPFLIWRTHAFRDRIHAANTRVFESDSHSTEQIASGINNIVYLRQIGLHGWSLRKITASFDRFQADSINRDRWNLVSETSVSLIMAAGYIVTVGYGGWLVVDDQLTIGSLLAFLTLRQRFTAPMQFVSQTYHGFINARAAFERLWDFYANPIEVGIDRGAEEPDPDFEELSVDDVEFRYHEEGNGLEGTATFIRGWNEVHGSNGSGKTTLIRLLMKILTPQKGRVAVDGRDIAHINNHAWRKNISIVPQHTYLFNESVRENIRLFDDRINDDMICEVLGKLNAKDDLFDCVQGLDAEVVEGGRNLSGGQRQKIAIARALLRNTPVYILDEPFVHIDKETKDRIRDYLRDILRDRIVIYISHDDFSDLNADNRIDIWNGGIRTMSAVGESA